MCSTVLCCMLGWLDYFSKELNGPYGKKFSRQKQALVERGTTMQSYCLFLLWYQVFVQPQYGRPQVFMYWGTVCMRHCNCVFMTYVCASFLMTRITMKSYCLFVLIADGPHHHHTAWSLRIFPSLPGSRLTIFVSRCKFSTLTTRQPMVYSVEESVRPVPVRAPSGFHELGDIMYVTLQLRFDYACMRFLACLVYRG